MKRDLPPEIYVTLEFFSLMWSQPQDCTQEEGFGFVVTRESPFEAYETRCFFF